jgi:hypothetical protein
VNASVERLKSSDDVHECMLPLADGPQQIGMGWAGGGGGGLGDVEGVSGFVVRLFAA